MDKAAFGESNLIWAAWSPTSQTSAANSAVWDGGEREVGASFRNTSALGDYLLAVVEETGRSGTSAWLRTLEGVLKGGVSR